MKITAITASVLVVTAALAGDWSSHLAVLVSKDTATSVEDTGSVIMTNTTDTYTYISEATAPGVSLQDSLTFTNNTDPLVVSNAIASKVTGYYEYIHQPVGKLNVRMP